MTLTVLARLDEAASAYFVPKYLGILLKVEHSATTDPPCDLLISDSSARDLRLGTRQAAFKVFAVSRKERCLRQRGSFTD